MADVDALARTLRDQGFKSDKQLRDRLDAEAGEQPQMEEPSADARALGAQPRMVKPGTNLRATGPYEVLAAFTKGEASVVVEQNTSPNPLEPRAEYRTVPITNAPVAIISGPNGFRVACNPDDAELVAAEAAAATGDWSLHERRTVEAALRSAGFDQQPDNPRQWVRNGFRVTLGLLLALPSILLGRLLGLVWFMGPHVVTNTTKKAVMDAWYGAASIGAPATHYYGLSTTTPTEAGGNVTEPSGGAYARVGVTNNTTQFPGVAATDPYPKRNANPITFPAATASWGTVTHATQHDASTAGNVTDWQPLSASQAISNGTTASFAANAWESNLT